MLNNEIRDFTYHEFKTDSDNFVKDIAKMLAIGCYSQGVTDAGGEELKPSGASIEYNWQIVNPAPDFALTNRAVSSFEELDSKEYELVVNDQIKKITNRATVKCTTLTEDKESLAKVASSQLGEVQKSRAEMYLQLYMPKYLCDTETIDPFLQEDGINIPLCMNAKTGRTDSKVRNYHWCLMRLFDNPNEDFSDPMPNQIDLATGELLEFNSASSEWSKLSWFTDFEDVFLSDIIESTKAEDDRVVKVPVSSSLTNKTKIRVMANMHPNRLALSVVGNPNVDYSDNRYLISTAYIGAIDSFEGGKKDIEGNFGIFTTSSSVPSIPKQSESSVGTFSGLDEKDDGSGEKLPSDEKWKVYNQPPGKVKIENSPESQLKAWIELGVLQDINVASADANGNLSGTTSFTLNYKKREIPGDSSTFSDGGRTSIVDNSLKATLGSLSGSQMSFDFVYAVWDDYNQVGYISSSKPSSKPAREIKVNVPVSDLKYSMLPIKASVTKTPGTLTESIKVEIDNNGLFKMLKKYIDAELAPLGLSQALVPGYYSNQVIKFSGASPVYYKPSSASIVTTILPTISVRVGFDEQGSIKKVVNRSERDIYGNLLKINYPKTFGTHTANCSTDFAMYRTDSADFWQSHFLMFSSTEQFMKKHQYGKSAYTNEYFADRIKVTHSAEGVRGVLSGFIVIDAESLFAFDELIVNKDFEKDLNKPEETYVYVPITAAYCPFANSPNERNGLGLLKEVRYSEHDDESKCEAALIKIAEQYIDSLYYPNNKEEIELVETSHNGLAITWASSDNTIINPVAVPAMLESKTKTRNK